MIVGGNPFGGGGCVKGSFHRGCLKPLVNTDIYIMTNNNTKMSYEVSMKIMYGWGSAQHEKLLKGCTIRVVENQ